MGGSPTRTPLLVGFAPTFLSHRRGKRKERERERERGAPPPPLVQFGLPWVVLTPDFGKIRIAMKMVSSERVFSA